MKFLIALLFVLIIIPIVYQTVNNPITAEDWIHRHTVWIQQYIDGDFSPFFEYPPLFHVLMLPVVLLFSSFAKYMQIVFGVISTLSIFYVSKKLGTETQIVLIGLVLATSTIYFQYAPALTPTVLDFIILSFLFLSLSSKKYSLMTLCLVGLMYSHWTGIFYLLGCLAYGVLYDRESLKWFAIAFIISIPILLVNLGNISVVLNVLGGQELSRLPANFSDRDMQHLHSFAETGQFFTNNWDKQFISNPFNLVLFSFPILFLMIPIAIFTSIRFKMKLIREEKIYFLFYILLTPLIVYNVWRYLSFAIIPLMFFITSIIARCLDEIV